MSTHTSKHSSKNLRQLSSADQAIVDLCEKANPSSTFSSELGLLNTVTTSQFIIWSPSRLPTGQSVCIASSRLGQKLDEQDHWFDGLRTLAVKVAREPKFLISAEGTTTHRFVQRIAELFSIPLVEFKRFPKKPSAKWFQKQTESADRTRQTIWYKPLATQKTKLNINDLLISIANSVVLLSVRNSGNIFKAAQNRLGDEPSNRTDPISTQLLIDKTLTPKKTETKLLESGATAWWIYSNEDSDSPEPKQNGERPAAAILSIDEIKADEFLLHWTRRRVGPWPDQNHSEYLDDLIFQTTRKQHGELSALCRILATRKILSSNDLTRDRRKVVCFSDLPINQLPNRRVFRSHLSRWDFEPYGIAIARTLLAELGAKKVIYGKPSDWDELDPSDKPYFQPETSRSEKINWQTEREWRIIGDLNLQKIPRDQAFIFVANESDCEAVASLSHWPIVIVGAKPNDDSTI